MPTNTTNQQANGNQTGSKDKEKAEALKKIEALIKVLGITDGSVKVVEKTVNGVPTIVILFKDALGPIGFGLNEISDLGKLSAGEYNGKDFMLSSAINFAATKIPAVAITLAFILVVHTNPVPTNYQNSVCPVDNTSLITPYLTH